MKYTLILLSLFILLSCSTSDLLEGYSSRPESNYKFSIIQGSTTETTTLIRVVYPKAIKVKYSISDSTGKPHKFKIKASFSRSFSPFKVDHIKIDKLTLGKTYRIEVKSNQKKWNDERYFRTLNTNKRYYKILVASCMNDSYNEVGNNIWPKAFAHKPDLSFLIGDNIYADTFSGIYLGSYGVVGPSHLWNRYIDHAMSMKLYRMKNLTPTYVTWDDHDFGQNDGGKDYKYKNEAKKLLNIFFPREESLNYNFGPGVSSHLNLGGINFLFLDNRSFRASKKELSGPHFGKEQRKWINKIVTSNEVNLLISGDQFFGHYHPFESFEGNHTITFSQFLKDIKNSKGKVAFLSGDRHLIEVMKIPSERVGYKTFEYTVSGIHTKMYPGSLSRDKNPLRIDGLDGVPNYAIFDLEKNENALSIKFKGFSLKGKEIETQQTLFYKN